MKSEKTELERSIKELCDKYSLQMELINSKSYSIFTDHATGLTLYLNFEEQSSFSFHFLQRTYDIIYDGDRSDVHVVISLMFAGFLRLFGHGISCSLFDIPHPVIQDEIWGRYIMPEQTPSFLGISNSQIQIEKVALLIEILAIWRSLFWEFAKCPCRDCMQNEDTENFSYKVPSEILNTVNNLYKSSSDFNNGNRIRPGWKYYYDMENEVTIIKSKELSSYLKTILIAEGRSFKSIDGIKGTLIVDREINNFLDHKSKKELSKIIKSLTGEKKIILNDIILLENMIILPVDQYIIGLGRLVGLHKFKLERELLRNRHNNEAELLFPIPLFQWHDKPCPDQFERLIKALLEREPNVKSVRIPAPINQGDKGRDLIIEWNVRNENIISQIQPPTSLIKIVGQCKVSNSTIGKNKVLDIRDTVETHNSNGYFLAVSTQISAALTEKLEELKSKGISTIWWNREDIELRLSKNQDLLPQFPKVVNAKHTVKFVDKE